MDPIDVVRRGQVQEDLTRIGLRARAAGVEVGAGSAAGRAVDPVGVALPDGARAADVEHVDPGVHLEPGIGRVGALDQEGERVEAGRPLDVSGSRLEGVVVVGVSGFSDLDEERVDVGPLGVLQQPLRLGLRLEAFMEGVGPQAAVLRGAQRHRRRCGFRRDHGLRARADDGRWRRLGGARENQEDQRSQRETRHGGCEL